MTLKRNTIRNIRRIRSKSSKNSKISNRRSSRRSKSNRRRSRNIRSRRSKSSKRSRRSRRSRNMRGGAEPEVEPVLETEIDLPHEVIESIIMKSSFKDFIRFKQVNKHYLKIVNDIISNPVLLKQKLLNISKDELINLNNSRSKIPIEIQKILPEVLKERKIIIYNINSSVNYIMEQLYDMSEERIFEILFQTDDRDKSLKAIKKEFLSNLPFTLKYSPKSPDLINRRYSRIFEIIDDILAKNPTTTVY